MNIRTGLLYLCFLLTCFEAVSQPSQHNIDVIEKKIAIAPEDTTKVLLYIQLMDLLTGQGDFDKSFAAVKKTWSLSNKLKYSHGLVVSIIRLGGIYESIKKDYPKAISYYLEAIKIAETHKDYTDTHEAYSCILNMYYYNGDYPSAMVIAQKGLDLAEGKDDKEMLARYNDQLGFIYLRQEKPAESIKYYSRYLDLARQTGNQMLVADAYNSLADASLPGKNYKAALDYLFIALNIYKKMDGEVITSKKKIVTTKSDRVAYTLYKISNTYKLQGRYQLAMQYALRGLKYTNGHHDHGFNQYDLASFYINAGEVYTALKDYGHAMRFLDSGLSISKTINHHEDMRDAYKGLSKAYALQKRYDSAYRYQQLYSVLKDSIINEKASRAIEQIRNSFEVDKKDKEIALLNQQQKLRETESEKKSLLLNIVVIFFTLLAVISYLILYIRNNHKRQKLAYEKQLAVQTERQRISGDMHDDIGTGLSTMLIYVNMLKSKLNGTLEYPDVERVALLGNELVAQMKEIVWSLNPVNDSLENLLIFIRQYFSQLFEPMPYRTNLIFPVTIPDVALKGVIRRNIFLCIKEALNNVIKHANADRVELIIKLDHGKLIIDVKDNGTGFPENLGSKFFSNGLNNMQHRMDQVEGEFKFFNNGGAVISIVFKLPGYPNG